MKQLLFSALLIFCAKSFAQNNTGTEDTLSVEHLALYSFTLEIEVPSVSITDRRLLNARKIEYIVLDGVNMQKGYTLDRARGVLYVPSQVNSTITIIYTR